MMDIYSLSDIAYRSSLGSPFFETDDEEWPVPNNGTYTHVYIPHRSPQLQSVEELQHKRRMQSVSAQTPHIVPADFVEASYASTPSSESLFSVTSSSPSSSSSSCQMEEILQVFDSVWEGHVRQETFCAQTPVQYPVNNNDFEQYSSPPSSSGSSPSYSPPSSPSSSPSSAAYSSPSPSGSHTAFTPPPQSAPFTSPPQTFIHPETMGGPSTSAYDPAYELSPRAAPSHPMNMGYDYTPVPPSSVAPAQYPTSGNTLYYRHFDRNDMKNTNVGTNPAEYYPQDLNTDPSNFDHPYSQYLPPAFSIQERNVFHRYDSAEPSRTEQHHSRPLCPRPSDPQSSAHYQQGPSSSFSPTRDAQFNHAWRYSLQHQQHTPVQQHIPPQQHISVQPPRQITSLRQGSPRSNMRHQPYQKPLAEDRARYTTNTNTAAQPRPSQKGKRSPTRPQKPIGSSLHYGETELPFNSKFGQNVGTSPYTSSEEDFVEQELPRPVKPSQSGPIQTINQDIPFAGNQTFKFVPMNMDTNTGTMRKSKANSTATVDVDPMRDSEAIVNTPPTEAPNSVMKRLFKPKTGTVMSSKREGEFVLVSGEFVPPKV
ncbi:hypothetical protein CPB84DRAFT_1779192 [Gymnopilus junonius]|uniref:Uncharacterized protein n=1 Tax=Gymnopilus junonius TaxID=109634 RepID=A0A9P5TLY5_GYMJU|nr:hypothetical protein CPB84DRAFT_1779192 [Gymnopilus junonius]